MQGTALADEVSYTSTNAFTANMGGGNDYWAGRFTSDVDLGSGDDTASAYLGAFSSNTLSQLDGGTGTDTLSFADSAHIANGTTLTLDSYGASNFENLTGSSANETLNGDENANILKSTFGGSTQGNDTFNGLGGNDTLTGGEVMMLMAVQVQYHYYQWWQ